MLARVCRVCAHFLLTSTTSASACLPWLDTKLARLRRHGSAALFAAATASFDEGPPEHGDNERRDEEDGDGCSDDSDPDSASAKEEGVSSSDDDDEDDDDAKELLCSHARHRKASALRCAASAPASLSFVVSYFFSTDGDKQGRSARQFVGKIKTRKSDANSTVDFKAPIFITIIQTHIILSLLTTNS